jgi:hyperosmotically inducible periplasmic protein
MPTLYANPYSLGTLTEIESAFLKKIGSNISAKRSCQFNFQERQCHLQHIFHRKFNYFLRFVPQHHTHKNSSLQVLSEIEMKKLIPFIISGVLVIGAVGCDNGAKNAEAPSTTNETTAPAKEASQTTTGKETAAKPGTDKVAGIAKTAVQTGLAGEVSKKLKDSLPGSKLSAEIKDGVVTVKGTVPSEAELKKIEPLISKLKGVKSVKVEAKVDSAKKAQ